MKLLLARHGEIAANLTKVYAGWGDDALTPVGVRQAEGLAESLAGSGVGTIYASPLKRTIQTAEIVAGRLGVSVVHERGLVEFRMGPWEGLSESEVAARYPVEWGIWQSRPAELNLAGRETLAELDERVADAMRRISKSHEDQTVLGVTHIAPIRVALLRQRGLALNEYRTIPVPNVSVSEFHL